jgi:hypothetical protein
VTTWRQFAAFSVLATAAAIGNWVLAVSQGGVLRPVIAGVVTACALEAARMAWVARRRERRSAP